MNKEEEALFLLEHEERRSRNLRQRVANLQSVIQEEREEFAFALRKLVDKIRTPGGIDYFEMMDKIGTVHEETRALFKIVNKKGGMAEYIMMEDIPREYQRIAAAWMALYELFDWDDK